MACKFLGVAFLALASSLISAVHSQILQQAWSNLANPYESGASASLFLPERECQGADGLVGVCSGRLQCSNRGGVNIGACPGLFKICCQEILSCGKDTKRNNTYFVHPANPPAHGMQCALRVHKLPGVCQLRLDFNQFSLRGPDPVSTRCERDRFLVTGQDFNSIVPPLCGENKGQHVYVDVSSVKGPIQLLTTTSDALSEAAMNRQWSIRVTQIPCNSMLKAPQGCLQYFTGSTGQDIRSINYGNIRSEEDSYPGGMDYTVCIRKELGLCRASFESVGKFGLGKAETDPGETGLTSCDNDYLLIGETRYCGGTGLPKPVPGQQGEETPRTRGTGPILFSVVTGTTARTPPTTRVGFNIRYKQESCQFL